MNKKSIKIFVIIVSVILIFSVIGLIAHKVNNKAENEIITSSQEYQQSEIVIGDQTVIYVDLTEDANNYEEITKQEETEQEVVANELEENETEASDENSSIFAQINQEYFDIEINLENGTVIADSTEIDMTEFLNITEEEKNELLSSTDDLYNYLSSNLIGDIKYENGEITVENPYSTNTIIVQTSNIEEIDDGGNIESVVKVAESVYTVHYTNAEDTKEGYETLSESGLVDNVSKDSKITVLDDESSTDETTTVSGKSTVSVQTVSESSNIAWGVSWTGLNYYSKKLAYAENDTEIKVAVLDSGVLTTHEVFTDEETSDRIDTTYSYNYVDNNTDITDDYGHGTKVAGIIAESTSSNIKIVPVKIIDDSGNGDYSILLEALATLSGKVDVINLSIGSEKEVSSSDKETIDEVLKSINEAGTIIVCAAGNGGTENVYYPASSDYTIAVSALSTDGTTIASSFSSYGEEIDYAAPGESLIVPNYLGSYSTDSGTSLAAPFVTSAIALIKAENSTYDQTQIEEVLQENCDDLGDTGKDIYYGYGRINFNTTMFDEPVIANIDISEDWGTTNVATVYALCANEIEYYYYSSSSSEPVDADWIEVNNTTNDLTLDITISENGEYYVWLKDSNGNITSQTFTIQYIDDTAPTIIEDVNSIATTGSTWVMQIIAQDTQSGISKVVWYYRSEDDTAYSTITDTYTTNDTGTTEELTITRTFSSELVLGETNYIYAEIYDMIGNYATTWVIDFQAFSAATADGDNANTNSNVVNNTNENANENTNTNSNTNANENTANTNDTNTNATTDNNSSNNITNINTNSSNSNNSSTSISTISANLDNTTSASILPSTGDRKILVLSIVVMLITIVFAFVKYKKLKDIK